MHFRAAAHPILTLSVLVALAGCGVLVFAQATQPSRAGAYGLPEPVAELSDTQINEASGLVASRRHPGLFYVHNDSGDKPRVFVVDRAGQTRATVHLRGARHVDWEDVALAPGPTAGAWDVVVGDIGDNRAQRSELVLYRFPEVDLDQARGGVLNVTPQAFRIRYADGPRDAEALVVDLRNGDAYIISKQHDGEPAGLYRLAAPWPADEVAVLPRVATVTVEGRTPFERLVTAADVSPDMTRLAVRTYLGGWEWRLPEPPPPGRLELFFGQTPQRLNLAGEPQGEALAYTHDGGALLTVSEGVPTYLYEHKARAAE